MDHRIIPVPHPTGQIWNGQNRITFFFAKKGDHFGFCFLVWNGENLADLLQCGWNPILKEMEKGLDCGESRVACPDATAICDLQVNQESGDQRGIELLEKDLTWADLQMRCGKIE